MRREPNGAVKTWVTQLVQDIGNTFVWVVVKHLFILILVLPSD